MRVDGSASVLRVEVELGEVRTWYDVTGDGEPLVLLHGGYSDSRAFEPGLGAYAERCRVFRYDRRGHGRTPDVGPLTYELMAADAIAFLEQVVGGPARLVGYSDGAVVALLVAVRRPELVERLVCISGQFSPDGLVPGMFDSELDPAAMADTPLAHLYGEVSPDGFDHFPEVVAKVNATAQAEPRLSEEDLAKVTAPALVMSADDDMVTLEHTVALYRGIPGAQLAVVPGTSHVLVVEKADLVAQLVLDFLGSGPVETILPIRRA